LFLLRGRGNVKLWKNPTHKQIIAIGIINGNKDKKIPMIITINGKPRINKINTQKITPD
jgi:hypothetical protein